MLFFPSCPALKVHLLPEYVIISLNIISVLQPAAAKFKEVWYHGLEPGSRTHNTSPHTHPHPPTPHILHSLSPSRSLTVQLCQFGRGADWSQEGAAFLNSWEDWVTQPQHQDICVTQLCCFCSYSPNSQLCSDPNENLMAHSPKPPSLSTD